MRLSQNKHPTDSRSESEYWEACADRSLAFVRKHYEWPGVLALHRSALGLDLVRAPLNVLLALPAMLLQLIAVLLASIGGRRAAARVMTVPRGLTTRTERELGNLLAREVLLRDLDTLDAVSRRLVARYCETRRSAADVTTALAIGCAGWILFDQFTPGALSTGREIADSVTRYTAIQNFFLGPTVGAWYFTVFPPETSLGTHAIGTVAVAACMSIVAAFSGLIADPVQSRIGIHRKRLQKWLRTARRFQDDDYRPLDPYLARIADIVDVFKGL